MFAALRRIWLLLFVLVALVITGTYLSDQVAEVQMPLHFTGYFLPVIILMQLVFWLLASLTWRNIVIMLHPQSMPLFRSYLQLALMGVGKYIPGKIWGVFARGAYMSRMGIGKRDVFVATFYEQTILFHAGFLVSAVLLVYLSPHPFTLAVVSMAALTVIVGPRLQQLSMRIIFALTRRFNRQALSESYRVVPLLRYIALMLGYIAIWLLVGGMLVGLYATFFDSPIDSRIVAGIMLANIAGITLGFFAVFMPGGIGVREAVSASVLYYFMPLPDAVLLSVVFRIWTVSMDIIGVLALFWAERKQIQVVTPSPSP